MFKRIQQLGVRVLFDDFGTGYASLSYLKKFPLDGLKIDRSFVLGLLADSDDAAIVGSTIGLSKQLGLTVMAEGIENRATADFLVSMGCEEGQGYFFGRPMPAEAFERQFLASECAAVSCRLNTRYDLAPTRDRDAEQESNEQAGKRCFARDRSDGREGPARLSRFVDSGGHAVDSCMQATCDFTDGAGYVRRGIDGALGHAGM